MINYLKLTYLCFVSCALCIFSCTTPDDSSEKADVIIYGGTSAAITAAVEVVQSGKSVIVVSPDKHLGGLSAGGLGFTDTGSKETIGGLSREFYHRVWTYYNIDSTWKWENKSDYGNKGQGTPAMDGENRTMWIFEPHIAEQVFEDFVSENNITIYRNEWLDRKGGVKVDNGKITSITTLSGKTYVGKVFIDATYEGDLMATSGVSYHVGREANNIYDEEWNGIQVGVMHHGHHFGDMKISPYTIPGDSTSGVLPKVSIDNPGIKGDGDNKIQAYCFRTCMSNHPDNRVPFPKPENYDPIEYELLARAFEKGWRKWFYKFDIIPNRKTDTNNNGPLSSDNIGMNYDYPEASYERRKQIIKEHEDYQKGLLYFVANDSRVPEDIQTEMADWGLAKDEFTDNGNWPHQLYIREARRMIGEYVTTEKDVLGKRKVPMPVGMGSYTMDSHNIQRYITPEGFVQNEGDIGVQPNGPYQISYGSIIPKKQECTNLLVPVCVSSSHIAFGSVRMEPVFMILGESAGTAAVISIDKNIAVQDVSYADLEIELLRQGQVLSVDPN